MLLPENDNLNLIDLLGLRATDAVNAGYRFHPDGQEAPKFLTFPDLDRRARAVGAYLAERYESRQPVLLCYPPGNDFLVGFFGALYADMIPVPAYPPRAGKSDPRLEAMAESCQPAVVLSSEPQVQNQQRLTTASPRLATLPWISTCSIPDDAGLSWKRPVVRTGDVALLQYTSGSTGDPKGVMLTHACAIHNVDIMAQVLGVTREMNGTCWLPLFHDMGLIGNIFQAVRTGLTLNLMAPGSMLRNPLRWLRLISDYKSAISGGPCFAFRNCLQRIDPADCKGLDLSSWKILYIGAEPIVPEVIEQFQDKFAPFGFRADAWIPCYGLAEASLLVTGRSEPTGARIRTFLTVGLEKNQAIPAPTGQRMVDCGPIAPDMTVAIVDSETGKELGDSQVGEIWVSGPSVAAGFWKRPDATRETFHNKLFSHPGKTFLRTGDLGFLIEGRLFVSGRLKDLIILRGQNIFPQDLEASATVLPEIDGCAGAAFALEGPNGPYPVLVQEMPRSFDPARGNELFLEVRRVLAEQYLVELGRLVLVPVGAIPRTSSGKIRRSECKAWLESGAAKPIADLKVQEASANTSKLSESDLAGWLRERLGRHLGMAPRDIDPGQPFASFGLDSPGITMIAAELEKLLGRAISPTLLFQAPTITELAHLLAAGPDSSSRAVEGQRTNPTEPIAVIGMGCRFPQAKNPEQFWQLLTEGRCVIGPCPPGREGTGLENWQAGYLEEVDGFDAGFFGIAPREAVWIDPQHRLLLETSWQALENAGMAPERLKGKSVGVFVGISSNDYSRLLQSWTDPVDPYLPTGNAGSMAAHRLSYHLDLTGPSLAIDSACSSSLLAVHQACQSLRLGECETALAGGINLILTGDISRCLNQAQMLSPTSRCRTFDATADGYVRGEGCGVVVLKPLSAAQRDGDPILAVLEATVANQDGRSNGITAPNGRAQADLVRRALRMAGRDASDVSYLETHGTGTPLGDPIEFDALKNSLGQGSPCALASVKTNLGHLEAAAGIAGLIKTVLQLRHEAIAPHLHLENINPYIQAQGSRFYFPRVPTEWPRQGRARLAGVSSFGFGGTNVHVLVGDAPQMAASNDTPMSQPALHVLPLSAHNESALSRMIKDYTALASIPDAGDLCVATALGRNQGNVRRFVAETSTQALFEQLGHEPKLGHVKPELAQKIVFLFPGQGSMQAPLVRELSHACPLFLQLLEKSAQVLKNLGGPELLPAVYDAESWSRTDFAQPALVAVEWSLAMVWKDWGIEPAAVLGHSLGEIAAVCVAGVFDLASALRLALERGRQMQDCPPGAMLACLAEADLIAELLKSHGHGLEVAALNSPINTVVSGSERAIAQFEEALKLRGIATRRLDVGFAFHSALIETALPALVQTANTLPTRTPRVRVMSSRTGTWMTDAPTAAHWIDHARRPVRFAEGITALGKAGYTHFVEIGPGTTLLGLGRAGLNGVTVWMPSLSRPGQGWESMVRTLGQLWVDGAHVAWDRFHKGVARNPIDLPNYPFQQERYWVDQLPRRDSAVNVFTQGPSAVHTLRAVSNWAQDLPRDLTGWEKLPERLMPLSLVSRAEYPRDIVDRSRQAFDRQAARYLGLTFRQLGWVPQIGERIDRETLGVVLGIIPEKLRLWGRLLDLAREEGWLDHNDVVRAMPTLEDPHATFPDLLAQLPEFSTEFRLAHRCATHLPQVLRGEIDPLQVLFGGEGAELAAQLYEKSPLAQFFNQLVTRTVAELRSQLPAGKPLRILEIGGGTGGTTSHLLPALAGVDVEYVFTDVSPMFVSQGKDRFGKYPFVHFKVLDLEKDLAEQGLAPGQFDLIVAANVLHALADLRGGVRQSRKLLAPHGVLLLLEGTGPRRLLDLIFGLTEGWWKFSDPDLRTDHPLLAPLGWRSLLLSEQFDEVASLPEEFEIADKLDQIVLLARATSTPVAHAPGSPVSGESWVIQGPDDELTRALAQTLRDRNQNVLNADTAPAENIHWIQRGGSLPGELAAKVKSLWHLTHEQARGTDDGALAWKLPTNADAANVHRLDVETNPRADRIAAILLSEQESRIALRGDRRFIVIAETKASTTDVAEVLPSTELASLPEAERRPFILDFMQRELASTLKLNLAKDDWDRPIQSLGLDSLMALQVRNRLETGLGIQLSVVDFLKGLSLNQLVDRATAQAEQVKPAAPQAEAPTGWTSLKTEEVTELSEGQINSLLDFFLDPAREPAETENAASEAATPVEPTPVKTEETLR